MKLELTTIKLDRNNRMLRCGIGKHNGKCFIRLDLWCKGFRFSTIERKFPSFCCQKCGKQIGYIGRILEFCYFGLLKHKCD